MIKKVWKIIGLLIFGIILALFVASFVFKDKIMNEIKKQLSENVNATIDWKDFDISFLKSFPQLNVKFKDLSIIGVDTFDQIPLFTSKQTEIDFNILPFLKNDGTPTIKYFSLEDALINIILLNDSTANYLITKADNRSDTSSFNIALTQYKIKNSTILYTDHTLEVKVKALGLNHVGKGDIAKTIYDLDTETTVDSLTVAFEGFNYLKNIKASLKSIINVNLDQEKYILNKADIALNNLKLIGNAVFQAKDGGWNINTEVKNNGDSFKNILSIMPYLDKNKDVKADGIATLALKVNGFYHGEKELYPAFDIKTLIKNGVAQYKGLPYPLKNVQLDAHITSSHPKMKDLSVNVKQLKLDVNSETIESNFNITDGMTNALIDGKLFANIRLENWLQAIPLQDVEVLKGSISSDVKLTARQSDIESQNYSAIKFDGALKGNNIEYKALGNPKITIGNLLFNAAPSQMKIVGDGIIAGKSQIAASGELHNPLAYFSDVKNITGNINIHAKKIDLNEWIKSTSSTSEEATNGPMDLSTYKFNEITTNIIAEEVLYDDYVLKDFVLKGNFGLQNMNIEQFTSSIGESDINISGKVGNIYNYLFENGLLTGKISLNSNNFNSNQFMTSEANASSDSHIFSVPERVSLDIDANIAKMKYTNHTLTNLKGKLSMNDNKMSLYECNADMLGGNVALEGLYETRGVKPIFNMKLNLNKIQFPKAFEQFVSIKQLAPVMKYIEGMFNTTLVLDGQLNKGMIPDFSTISASGLIETLNGSIKGLKPLNAASDKLGVSNLSPLSIKDTKNWFDIKDGTVEIKEFTKEIGDIGLRVKGNHKIQGPMNYEMIVKIPREKLKKSGLASGVEKGWSFLEQEADKKGIDINQGEFVDVKINIKGMLSNPDMKFSLLGTSGKTMKEELQEEVNKSIEQAKDSIKKETQKRVEQAKDSLRKVAEKELENAKKKAEEEATKVLNEAKEKAKKEVETKIDTLIGKSVSDSLKKKAEEVIKDKTGKEVEEIKDKLKDWNPFKKKKG